jgi:hypothetical protein
MLSTDGLCGGDHIRADYKTEADSCRLKTVGTCKSLIWRCEFRIYVQFSSMLEPRQNPNTLQPKVNVISSCHQLLIRSILRCRSITSQGKQSVSAAISPFPRSPSISSRKQKRLVVKAKHEPPNVTANTSRTATTPSRVIEMDVSPSTWRALGLSVAVTYLSLGTFGLVSPNLAATFTQCPQAPDPTLHRPAPPRNHQSVPPRRSRLTLPPSTPPWAFSGREMSV